MDKINITEKTNDYYRKQFEQGYRFRSNVWLDGVDEFTRRYEAEGLEVFVGKTAFTLFGDSPENMRAILTRGKS